MARKKDTKETNEKKGVLDKTQEMIRKVIMIFFSLAFLILLIVFGPRILKNIINPDEPVTAYVVEAKLSKIGEFATAQIDHTGFFEIKDSREFFGLDVPFTKHVIRAEYNYVIKIGYQVSDIQVSVDGKVITVYLPKPQILENHIDVTNLYEDNNILNPIECQELYDKIDKVEAAVGSNTTYLKGAYTTAEENAKELITNLLVEYDEYDIVFVTALEQEAEHEEMIK